MESFVAAIIVCVYFGITCGSCAFPMTFVIFTFHVTDDSILKLISQLFNRFPQFNSKCTYNYASQGLSILYKLGTIKLR